LVAIIGKSGSGKSTLLKSILGEMLFQERSEFIYSLNPSCSYVC